MSQSAIPDIKKDKLAAIAWLSEHFPAAFSVRARDIKPLKIGIFDDIIDFYERLDSPTMSKKQIREGLNYYSASPAYLKSQQCHAARIDLFGNELDEVTEAQAAYAAQRFAARYGSRRQANK
jgi:ProP effector